MIGMETSLNYVARPGPDGVILGCPGRENGVFVDFRLLRFVRTSSLPRLGIGLLGRADGVFRYVALPTEGLRLDVGERAKAGPLEGGGRPASNVARRQSVPAWHQWAIHPRR